MVSSGTASTGICVGLAPFTFGLSLIGGVAGAASAGNAAKKLSIIEKEMNNRGTHPNLRKRDIFGGYGLGATVGAISHGFGGHLLDSAVHHVVSPTSYTAHCHALKTAEHAADKLGMRGGKAVEKKAYGTVIAARRQYGNGEYKSLHPTARIRS